MAPRTSILALAVAMAGSLAQAQVAQAPPDARGTPAAAPTPAAGLRHDSALRGYRAFRDEPVAPWREANETVRRIGGWQAYGRESYEALRSAPAAQPAKTGAAAPAPSSAPAAPADHRHHGTTQHGAPHQHGAPK